METYQNQVTNHPLAAVVANKLALTLFTFAKPALAANFRLSERAFLLILLDMFIELRLQEGSCKGLY